MNYELNEEQLIAKDMIVEWFENTNSKQVFVLAGYAGTGKTFLINKVISDYLKLPDNKVTFATPTGKAASVLIQRGRDASTIHHLIYTPNEEVKESVDDDGNIVKTRRIKFVKKASLPEYKLIVIDEISMVDRNIFEDLKSFGIPILCTGDIGQLPPISNDNNLLKNPDYNLTKIVRQSEDNPIIKIATMAREKKYIPYGDYGGVLVIDQNSLTESQLSKILTKASQIIVGTNKTRRIINDKVRELKGIDIELNKLPMLDEKIICLTNNWEQFLDYEENFNLVNGTISKVLKSEIVDPIQHIGRISFVPDFLEEETEDIVFDTKIFTENDYEHDVQQRVFLTRKGNYVLKKWIGHRGKNEDIDEFNKKVVQAKMIERSAEEEHMINRFEFAYAISCHKSQGSEFDSVVLFDESRVFKDSEKWLYTGITRAKKKLIIIR